MQTPRNTKLLSLAFVLEIHTPAKGGTDWSVFSTTFLPPGTLEGFRRLTCGTGAARSRGWRGVAAVGCRMGAPPGRGRLLRPGTGLAGRAFCGGRGLEKSWGESHKHHSKARGDCLKENGPQIFLIQIRGERRYTAWFYLKTNCVHVCTCLGKSLFGEQVGIIH